MQQSRFRSNIERLARGLFAMTVAVTATACSDDAAGTCGPGAATADGVTLTVGTETFAFTDFTAGRNNDCSIAGSGVISVTVAGHQVGDTAPLTLCLPRPDLLTTAPVTVTEDLIPPDPTDRAQLIDASAAMAAGCRASINSSRVLGATATFTGLCDDGTNAAGFALTLGGTVPVTVTCPGGTTLVNATLAGTVAVTAL